MAISQLVTVAPGDRIQAGVWNNEIQNIITQPISLISPTTGAINFALQPHTGLLPSVVSASSGTLGQFLFLSTAGTAWGPTYGSLGQVLAITPSASAPSWQTLGVIQAVTAKASSTGFSFNSTAFQDAVNSSATVAVNAAGNRLLIQGGANINAVSLAGVNNALQVQIATSTGSLPASLQVFSAPSGGGGQGIQASAAWSLSVSPGSTASRTYVIQALHTNTTGTASSIASWNYTFMEVTV